MATSIRTRLGRVIAVTALATLAATGTATADAGALPKPGSKCMMSGVVDTHGGKTSVCTKNAKGNLRWSKALPAGGKLSVTVHDGWAKAAEKGGMSGAFGALHNKTGKPVNIVAVSSPYAMAVQMHEMVMKDGAMVMQETAGGFKIPANGMLELKPGGNHLMFMGIKKNIKSGTMIPVTMIASDGSRTTVKLLAKVFNGANEEYDGGHSGGMN